MSDQRRDVATAVATALLAGAWERADMMRRVRVTLGRRRAPVWLSELVVEVIAAYRDPPADRPRELAAYLQTVPAWDKAWGRRRDRWPRIVTLTPTPTRAGEQRWPVTRLDDLADLARLLDVDQGELAWFADVRGWERTAAEALRHYRWWALPTRSGHRLVAAPKPRLKEIQRRLLRHLLEPIPVHAAAHGSVTGRSVRTALDPHAGRLTVIRMDLEAFFPSIAAGRVWGLLRTAGLPEAVAHTATGLLTTVVPLEVWRALPVPASTPDRHWRLGDRLATPHLPIGAPSSPRTANLIAYGLDRRLTGLAARFDATYTRYVDDLTFSGGAALRGGRAAFVRAAEQIVADEGFAVHDAKTVVLGAAGRQAALGAVLNARPTLPRPERDALRALLHNCARHGWRTQTRGRENFPDYVRGRVAWAGGLDPVFGARLRVLSEAVDWS